MKGPIGVMNHNQPITIQGIFVVSWVRFAYLCVLFWFHNCQFYPYVARLLHAHNPTWLLTNVSKWIPLIHCNDLCHHNKTIPNKNVSIFHGIGIFMVCAHCFILNVTVWVMSHLTRFLFTFYHFLVWYMYLFCAIVLGLFSMLPFLTGWSTLDWGY